MTVQVMFCYKMRLHPLRRMKFRDLGFGGL